MTAPARMKYTTGPPVPAALCVATAARTWVVPRAVSTVNGAAAYAVVPRNPETVRPEASAAGSMSPSVILLGSGPVIWPSGRTTTSVSCCVLRSRSWRLDSAGSGFDAERPIE